MLVSGIGMGAIWVPMFEIIVGDVADHEVGSASGVLQAVQQLGMSLGIAAIGTVFFGAIGSHAARADFVTAAELTTLITVGLIAAAFAVSHLLPRQARQPHAPADFANAEPALA
jgi:MFS family permease